MTVAAPGSVVVVCRSRIPTGVRQEMMMSHEPSAQLRGIVHAARSSQFEVADVSAVHATC